MRECEYLHPIDKMERISREDLCKRFDEVLDKVDKDDIGYVITDAGKKDMVLCPARWFLFQLDDDFGCVIILLKYMLLHKKPTDRITMRSVFVCTRFVHDFI